MKVCTIICEFNPFHNGHKYLLEHVKATGKFDAVLCLMSGHFTQRGDIAVLDKYTRAKHAIWGGADLVVELPTPFAVAPAEVFAEGAVKLLASIPEVTTLAFGCESATKEELTGAARLLVERDGEFQARVKEELASGIRYGAAVRKAFCALGGDEHLLNGSNNVLALEYTKAILRLVAKIDILPIPRVGANYNDEALANSTEGLDESTETLSNSTERLTDNRETLDKENKPYSSATSYSSATAIRKHLGEETLKNAVPPFVFADLPQTNAARLQFERLQQFAILNNSAEEIAQVYGCSEGLENKLKSLCQLPFDDMIAGASCKRYTAARVKRVACANLLKLKKTDTERFLKSQLYLKPLAVKKERADELLAILGKSAYPVVVLQRQLEALSSDALACLQASLYADKVFEFITSTPVAPFTLYKV